MASHLPARTTPPFKVCDHDIVRAHETHSKALPTDIENEFQYGHGPKCSVKTYKTEPSLKC